MIQFSNDKFLNAFLTICLVLILSMAGFCLFKSIFADGKVTHCYIEPSTFGYRVVAHRDWRFNATVGVEKTSEEAYDLMKKVCP